MRTLRIIGCVSALLAVLVPPFFYLAGWVAMDLLHGILLGATVVWFVCAPPLLWGGKPPAESDR